MDPYQPPPQTDKEPVQLSSKQDFVAAAIAALLSITIGGPGLAYSLGELTRRMASGRRYATYDPEVSFFGFYVTPAIAQSLALIVAPLLLVMSFYFVQRGWRKRRS